MGAGIQNPTPRERMFGALVLVLTMLLLGVGGRHARQETHSFRGGHTDAVARVAPEPRSADVKDAGGRRERPRFTRESLEVAAMVLAVGAGSGLPREMMGRYYARTHADGCLSCRPYVSVLPPPVLA